MGATEELLEPSPGIGDGSQRLDHRLGISPLPAQQGTAQQVVAPGEVPIAAPLGDAELLGERLDGYGLHASRRQRGEGGVLPVLDSQAARTRGGNRHLSSVPYGVVLTPPGCFR